MKDLLSKPLQLEAMWENCEWSFFSEITKLPLADLKKNDRLGLMVLGAALQLDEPKSALQTLHRGLKLLDSKQRGFEFIASLIDIQIAKLFFLQGEQRRAVSIIQEAWNRDGYLLTPLFYEFLVGEAELRVQSGSYRTAIQVWQDVAMIMQQDCPDFIYERLSYTYRLNKTGFGGTKDENLVRGDCHKHEVLRYMHAQLRPDFYFEIGVDGGKSLALSNCRALGVDARPELDLKVELSSNCEIVNLSSDKFFELHADGMLSTAPDLALIDGMHLFEFALRDFINLEKYSKPYTLVVVDDVFPCHPKQAERVRQTGSWTGDIWKLLPILKKYRPDLTLITLDSYTTGLLLISGLDSKNNQLSLAYPEIMKEYQRDIEVPSEYLTRIGALRSDDSLVDSLLSILKEAKERSSSGKTLSRKLATLKPFLNLAGKMLDSPGRPPLMIVESMRKEIEESKVTLAKLYIPQQVGGDYSERYSLEEKIYFDEWYDLSFFAHDVAKGKKIRFDPMEGPGLVEIQRITINPHQGGNEVIEYIGNQELRSIVARGDAVLLENNDKFLVYSYSKDPILLIPWSGEKGGNMEIRVRFRVTRNTAEIEKAWLVHKELR
ncbi:class I SAM-dependent methyltransferase [Reinekea blandensis]|uniref:Uncharacterized protein n=1 Tax=Reinekea blandensis MED297 TaxID=314283 RepID=A4BIY5_9GAMM|nr:class I SAM-dependent methyltransferase [Reinekea blandensis]EAR07918.1 hypothetical protein MED297_15350 [Reinekea sp. MED297] [Reinekea blandensis MED297]